MRCPTCGGANVDGAKFCGVCGHRLAEGPPTIPPGAESPLAASRRGDEPRVTGETRTMNGGAVRSPAPRAASKPARPAPRPELSMGESLRVPESSGARIAKIGIILALDAVLAIAGIIMMTGGGAGDSEAGVAALDGGAIAADDGGTVATGGGGPATGGSGPATGGGAPDRPGGGGSGPATGGSGPATGGSGPATGGSGPATGGSGPAPIDAGRIEIPSIFDPIDAPPAVEPPPIDAAPVIEPPPIDAAPAVEPAPLDAAPAGTPDATSSDPGTDAPEAAASAADIARHLARLIAQSASRMDRCYQNATKALPADQPLSGEVDIGLAVMPTGQVQNVRVVRNTSGSSDLAACVQAGVASWTFPPHSESEPVEFVSPFRFGPGRQ